MEARELNLFPCGVVTAPPSKSVTHRAVICAGLAVREEPACGDAHGEESVIRHVSRSEDVLATLGCMEALGARCVSRGDSISIRGVADSLVCGCDAGKRAREPVMRPEEPLVLDCGESGSTLRFLMPLAACLGRPVMFKGRGRLMERPLEPFFDLFAGCGVTVRRQEDKAGEAPPGLTVMGSMRSGVFSLPGHISSQFVTGLLLALPLLPGDSRIVMTSELESSSYVDVTLDVMRAFGVAVEHQGYREFFVKGNQRYGGRDYTVEGDYSQAAFFLVAAALGRQCACGGLAEDSRQGDRRIVDILRRCGAEVERREGVLYVRPGVLTGVTVDISDIPDLVAPLAVLFCFCRGESRIINGGRLRYKESDRLAAVACELRKLGADIVEDEDALIIHGVEALRGGRVDSWGDHRIAMMLAVAAYRSTGAVWLTGSGSVAKSYPDFFEIFGKAPASRP